MDQRLFSEVQIGPITVRNRIVFCAPSPSYAGLDEDANRPTPEIAAYWEYLAGGGLGLVVGEPQSVHPTSTSNPRVVENVSDAIVPLYRRVTDAVHDRGARIFGHLWHAGFLAAPAYRNLPLWAPSAVRAPVGALVPAGGGAVAHAMDQREIRALIGAFGSAARRLREANFDGIEVNAAAGFLLAEFLSPKVNLRDDEYGGSLENRCRFVVEVLNAVREAVGSRLAVGVRLSPDPYVEPGIVEADLTEIAARLARLAPIDYVNVMPALVPDASVPQGGGAEVARAVRSASGLTVIYNGQLTDPAAAASLLDDTEIDLVGMTRALLADSRLPDKVQAGRADEVRPCIACNQTCTGGMGGLLGMATPYCLFNPAPAETAPAGRGLRDGDGLRLLVIGAGLAGLEAARLARMRGFAVTIWERGNDPGGQVWLAAKSSQRALFAEAVAFYRRQLDAWGIELELGVAATPEAVDSFNPDVVVVATGSVPAMPSWYQSLNGGAPEGMVTEVRAALAGSVRLGKRVVITLEHTEHGYQALPLAELLADRGHEVTVVSPAFEPSINQDFYTSEHAYRRLLRKGVQIMPSTEVTGVRPSEVEVRNVHNRRRGSLPADSVVVAAGGVADDGLYFALKARRANVFATGDCVAPRDMVGAISDGLRVMQKIAPPVRV